MSALRLNVTLEVPDVASAAWPARLAGAIALTVHAVAPSAGPDDRIERRPGTTGDALAAFAARSPGGATRYVRHGALRVPAAADGQFRQAVRYLSRDGAMRSIFARVERAHTAYTLRIVHHDEDAYEDATRTIDWDPHSALRTTTGGRQSPALGLGHELDHAAEPWRARRAGEDDAIRGYDTAEERRVIRGAEAHAARTLGEGVRSNHRGTCYRVASPTGL